MHCNIGNHPIKGVPSTFETNGDIRAMVDFYRKNNSPSLLFLWLVVVGFWFIFFSCVLYIILMGCMLK